MSLFPNCFFSLESQLYVSSLCFQIIYYKIRVSNRATEVDPAWKKAAIMLWKQIADHKHASKFMNPVTDEIANKYSTVIKGET